VIECSFSASYCLLILQVHVVFGKHDSFFVKKELILLLFLIFRCLFMTKSMIK